MHLLLDDILEDVIDDDHSTSHYRRNWSVDDSCQIDQQRWKWQKVWAWFNIDFILQECLLKWSLSIKYMYYVTF